MGLGPRVAFLGQFPVCPHGEDWRLTTVREESSARPPVSSPPRGQGEGRMPSQWLTRHLIICVPTGASHASKGRLGLAH